MDQTHASEAGSMQTCEGRNPPREGTLSGKTGFLSPRWKASCPTPGPCHALAHTQPPPDLALSSLLPGAWCRGHTPPRTSPAALGTSNNQV